MTRPQRQALRTASDKLQARIDGDAEMVMSPARDILDQEQAAFMREYGHEPTTRMEREFVFRFAVVLTMIRAYRQLDAEWNR